MVEIEKRKHIGKLFQHYYKTGVGAEIGVYCGLNSRSISNFWKGTIILVDPWEKLDNWNSQINERDLKVCYERTLEETKIFEDRRIIIKKESLEAAEELFGIFVLDWVYIDAQHSYEACKADIEAWYRLVRTGGIISGHDYLDGTREEGYVEDFGVKSAVDEFADKYGYTIYTTSKDDIKSWWFVK